MEDLWQKKTEKIKDLNHVMFELAGQIIPLIVKFDVRAMAKNIRREFGVSLTEEYIESVLLDILWRVHEENPDIVDRKIRTKSRGKIIFELSFCPVPIQEFSQDDFDRLLCLQRVNT